MAPPLLHFDDLLAVLHFLNRSQLLRFQQASRRSNSIVQRQFASAPYIYAHLSLFKGYPAPFDESGRIQNRELFVQLTALNCCCEQQFGTHISHLHTYKCVISDECSGRDSFEQRWPPRCTTSTAKDGDNEQQKVIYREFGEPHQACVQWTQVHDPNTELTADPYRMAFCEGLLQTYNDHAWEMEMEEANAGHDESQCCTVWRHRIHDEWTKTQIYADYKYAHRKPTYPEYRQCGGLELRTNDVGLVQQYLQVAYVRIYKLDLLPLSELGHNWVVDNEADNLYSDIECHSFLQMLTYIVDRRLISANAYVLVDFPFLVNLFDRCHIGRADGDQMLCALSQCAQLQIAALSAKSTTNIRGEDGGQVQRFWMGRHLSTKVGILLLMGAQSMEYDALCRCRGLSLLTAKALLIEATIPFDAEQIKQLLCAYNPEGRCHGRLFVFSQRSGANNIVQHLVEHFVNSRHQQHESCTYFALVFDVCRPGQFEALQYNAHTSEHLRIMPILRYSLYSAAANDVDVDAVPVPIYVARYSSTLAHHEFSALHSHIEAALVHRMQKCAQIVADNEWYRYQTNDSCVWECLAYQETLRADNFDRKEYRYAYSAGPFFRHFFANCLCAPGRIAGELFNSGPSLPIRDFCLPPLESLI